MFEQILQLVQQHAQDAVVNNPAVPNENNEAVMQEAGHSITNGLQNLLSGCGLNTLFQGGNVSTNNPAIQNISSNFISSITQKFGISSEAASGIAASVIPNVLNSIQNMGNGSGDIQNILSSLTSGNTNFWGIANSIGSKLGLDKDVDVDFDDLKKLF
ncbi:MAG: hypothetical protein K2W79_07545 [Hydrotalea flava]|uniref:hypothetical protein n=1 Tax=Hydrotalea TaxID=1004300 RepID=UPI0010261609|nr:MULTISPECIES: hypothetical protein [Hydrotalea]MBY0348098.1 hypothetical protein [Hydrotalea flava]RWZ90813.1 MAG: hypothetical protein EO766_01240 [Hydrotalea sp. AMD]